ncbi:MAG: hypothetical protein WC223_05475 [Bacteroidales bacterium]|jgi:hypothetical protein
MKTILIASFILCLTLNELTACTTVIISGKYTPDGNPLLWKNRDGDKFQNKIMYFTDGKYNYTGLVNSIDKTGKEIWCGTNSKGFAIMNAASYNLKDINDTTKIMDLEGLFIKKALKTCASLKDFETMLDTMTKPLRVEANFGVIDAQGGAAFYEVNNFSVAKFDANDPKISPLGYIVRTNYSFTGRRNIDNGYIRFATADELFSNAAATNDLTVKYIFKYVARCLKHSLTKTDLSRNLSDNPEDPDYVYFEDYIPRYSSLSSIVIQGVKKGTSPEFTTMWTVLGFPLCSVVIPVWVSGGEKLPSLLAAADTSGIAPICNMSLQLKSKCFPITRIVEKKYINRNALLNKNNTGILQKLSPLEDKIFEETENMMSKWRKSGMAENEIQIYYKHLDEMIRAEYKRIFNL